ncbi:hypothetical protein DL89DRAFT_132005 [Linderina pennispora]|uniref:Uncharacterized protein n=1 Tax=Linderina pennispora TaxID=61395 RepID=A0A1Y1VV35_9FUNG|nr:uncharacterized protein DL89DRAFT_132005 [Linderina pennispora]ORX65149.1 hypothetical protein DL89DRAFT_132005 [Linderina pennispora]
MRPVGPSRGVFGRARGLDFNNGPWLLSALFSFVKHPFSTLCPSWCVPGSLQNSKILSMICACCFLGYVLITALAGVIVHIYYKVNAQLGEDRQQRLFCPRGHIPFPHALSSGLPLLRQCNC